MRNALKAFTDNLEAILGCLKEDAQGTGEDGLAARRLYDELCDYQLLAFAHVLYDMTSQINIFNLFFQQDHVYPSGAVITSNRV